MTLENRETMQRAIGIIEGVASVADTKVGEILICAVEMLDSILESEEKE